MADNGKAAFQSERMDTLTSELLFAWPFGLGLDGLLAAVAPRWVLGALLVATFAALSALTMFLARFPTRDAPPPLPDGPAAAARRQETEEDGPDGEG